LLVPLWIPVMLLVPSFVLLGLSAMHRLVVSLKLALGVSA